MLESFFRQQNKADLLNYRDVPVLIDRIRTKVVNCLVDFMIDAFGNGDLKKITNHHKKLTARATISLFIGLKSNNELDELVI